MSDFQHICIYSCMARWNKVCLLSWGPAACGAHFVPVGPTCVQAVGYMYSFIIFTMRMVWVILCNKKEWSVPLASQGSLSNGSVSKKLEAQGMLKKALRVPRDVERADAAGVCRFESMGSIMQRENIF